MALVEWTPDLAVNIESIDNQHKKLFQLIDDFYSNIQKNSSKEVIGALIKALDDYTVYHFTLEEGYLRDNGYPDYERHKAEHDGFLKKVQDLEQRYAAGKLVLTVEITNFIKTWLQNHIKVTDKRYSTFLLGKGVK